MFFKRNKEATANQSEQPEYELVLEGVSAEIVIRCLDEVDQNGVTRTLENELIELLKKKDRPLQARALLELSAVSCEWRRRLVQLPQGYAHPPHRRLVEQLRAMRHVIESAARRKLPLSAQQLGMLLETTCENYIWGDSTVLKHLVNQIAKRWEELEEELRPTLIEIYAHTDEPDLKQKIEQLLNEKSSPAITAGEAWTVAALEHLKNVGSPLEKEWNALLWHCRKASNAKPSARWSKEGHAVMERIGVDAFHDTVRGWIALLQHPRTGEMARPDWHEDSVRPWLMDDHHADTIRGLIWLTADREDAATARAIADAAVSCYKKVPGIGPRATKVGNACVYALGVMPGESALAQLARLRVKLTFGTAISMITKALDRVAEREGVPRNEIEEIAVPAYGFTGVGVLERGFGEHRATLRVTGTSGTGSTVLTWINDKGKAVKSVPAAVKRDHADGLKDLKAIAKDVQKMLPAQRDRIDGLFLEQRSWSVSAWRERYLDHPVVGTIARRLIWVLEDAGGMHSVAWLPDDPESPVFATGQLVNPAGEPVIIDEHSATVTLWHPIDTASDPDTVETRADVLAWRRFYEDRRIAQPFKQAHREVYLLTDAERETRSYSNRFAAHVLRNHQATALMRQRGWNAQLAIATDCGEVRPQRDIEPWGLRAEFWIEGAHIDQDYGAAFTYVVTDQVRFYQYRPRTTWREEEQERREATQRLIESTEGQQLSNEEYLNLLAGNTAASRRQEPQPIPLDEIPPLVLSETMRDVDLFVGVASVGNNPEWEDGGPGGHHRDYWRSYAFGELNATASTRKELLERLVPRLKIAERCLVTERFLFVRGNLRVYKIHLGSGNIMMEPNDQYLCIVPGRDSAAGRTNKNLHLPFEGDRVLSIILSKAFMLAADEKITDPTIRTQINRNAVS